MPLLSSAFLAFLISAVTCGLVILSVELLRSDDFRAKAHGPQALGLLGTPRLGGIGVVAALWVFLPLGDLLETEALRLGSWVMVCALPTVAAGFIEDFTGRVRPLVRLLATAVSALAGCLVLSITLHPTGVALLDGLLGTPLLAIPILVLAVSGFSNAMNLVDGLNGLASMTAMLMLGALAGLALMEGDTAVATLALLGIGALLGFFVWNFPGGRIFLGDGGAYFIGFWISQCALLLISRNPAISPLFVLLLCAYPVTETVYSIYRRHASGRGRWHAPDALHLHSLVFRRLLRWTRGHRADARTKARLNSRAAAVMWSMSVFSVGPAVLFSHSTWGSLAALLAFVAVYVAIYQRIMRFRTPRWMRWLAGHRGHHARRIPASSPTPGTSGLAASVSRAEQRP